MPLWLTIHSDNFSQFADYYGGRERAKLTVTTDSNCADTSSEICDSTTSDIFVRESSTDVVEFSTSLTTLSDSGNLSLKLKPFVFTSLLRNLICCELAWF